MSAATTSAGCISRPSGTSWSTRSPTCSTDPLHESPRLSIKVGRQRTHTILETYMNPSRPALVTPPHYASADEAQSALYARVTWRLIPLLFLCYVAAYLDRVNVGFAKLQMLQDLHFSETVYGLGAGIFFLGYFIFEVPSNVILHKVGARLWIARVMITWAVISACMMFTKTPTVFYILRFLLGLAEAGLFPGVILYLTYWYPSERRGKIIALFMTGIPISGVIGGPLSGWILHSMGGVSGLAGWQWLFLIEAIP